MCDAIKQEVMKLATQLAKDLGPKIAGFANKTYELYDQYVEQLIEKHSEELAAAKAEFDAKALEMLREVVKMTKTVDQIARKRKDECRDILHGGEYIIVPGDTRDYFIFVIPPCLTESDITVDISEDTRFIEIYDDTEEDDDDALLCTVGVPSHILISEYKLSIDDGVVRIAFKKE